jgi:hypothetical protein
VLTAKSRDDSQLIEYEGPTVGAVELRNYFGDVMSDTAEPQAFSVFMKTPHQVLRPHFHPVRQYQIFTKWTGSFGQHPVKPGTVHYADEYSPYGPITAGPDGVEFFTLRCAGTFETFFMPESRDDMPMRAGRSISALAEPSADRDREHRTDPSVNELFTPSDDGLHAYAVHLGPHGTQTIRPRPDVSGYWVVMAGSLIHEGDSFGERSLVFCDAHSEPYEVQAGADGLDLIVTQFPDSRPVRPERRK